ncbi:MAG: FAD-binding oxidoreductase [Chloroflexota bacterium]
MTRPLWIDPEQQRYPTNSGDRDADIAIVGAGLSGVGAAWALRDSGASVVLLEAQTLASAASGRNAGFVLAGPACAFHDAVAAVGAESAYEIWAFTLDNNRLIARLVDEIDLDCDYMRRGSMSLAISAAEMTGLQASYTLLSDAGVSSALVSATDLPRPFDGLYAGGLYFAGNAEMNPGLFVRGVAAHLADRVAIFERSRVRRIYRNDRWRIETEGGTVTCRAVVLCTNAYTPQLIPAAAIEPVLGQVLATERLSRLVVPFPMYANFGYQYWRQTPQGNLVVGGWRDTDMESQVGYRDVVNDDIQRQLHAFATMVAGDTVSVATRWVGVMGFTSDMFPFVGEIEPGSGLHIAAGYSGHGVSMAFLCGGQVARQALGECVTIPAAFKPGRFDAAGRTH